MEFAELSKTAWLKYILYVGAFTEREGAYDMCFSFFSCVKMPRAGPNVWEVLHRSLTVIGLLSLMLFLFIFDMSD